MPGYLQRAGDRAELQDLQSDLMLALARCGDHAQAAKIAAALVATPPKDESLCPGRLRLRSRRGAAGGDTVLAQRYTDRGPRLPARRPKNEAGPTSRAWRRIPTSNRSAMTRHSKPCSTSSGGREQDGRERGGLVLDGARGNHRRKGPRKSLPDKGGDARASVRRRAHSC